MAGLDVLETRREREIFLDAWYEKDRKSFNYYHKRYRGSGRTMINSLENDNTRLFIEVFDDAEEIAQGRR